MSIQSCQMPEVFYLPYFVLRSKFPMEAENLVLFLLLLPAILISIFYLAAGILILRKAGAQQVKDFLSPFTLLVCTRNGLRHIWSNMHHLFFQQGREKEILVVDDRSTDGSLLALYYLCQRYSLLRVVRKADNSVFSGKKGAMDLGIRTAATELILCTDVDCRPASDEWAAAIVGGMGEKRSIVIGYAPLHTKRKIIPAFVRFENLLTSIEYLGFALLGIPFMGVGRNLLFRRKIYALSGGYGRHGDVLSGDDDLLVNAVARRGNTAVVLDRRSFVYSEGKEVLSDFLRQKHRHMEAGKYYRSHHMLFLGVLNASFILCYPAFIFGYFFLSDIVLLQLFLFLLFLRWAMFGFLTLRLGGQRLLSLFPFLEVFYGIYLMLMVPRLFQKPSGWS